MAFWLIATRAGGVQQADRLVRELTGGNIPIRELDGAGDGLVQDPHAVVLLQDRGEPAHHPRGAILVGLLDLDDLEPSGQGRVLFKVFLVFGPGRGGDRAELAARQRRLEQVGGVALAGLAAGADHRVGLVDEEDDRHRGGLDLGDDLLEPVLELPLDAGPGLEQPEVEGAEHDVLEHRGNVPLGNSQRQALDDGRLADAGLAGQDRVVLAAADQDVDHLADLGLTADHRVDLSLRGPLGQVDRVLVEGRRLGHSCRLGTPRRLPAPIRAAGPGSSLDPATSFIRLAWSTSTLIFAQLARGIARSRPSSSSSRSARRSTPERTFGAWYRIDASTQASRMSWSIRSESVGVRWLPVRNWSSTRVKSRAAARGQPRNGGRSASGRCRALRSA